MKVQAQGRCHLMRVAAGEVQQLQSKDAKNCPQVPGSYRRQEEVLAAGFRENIAPLISYFLALVTVRQ